MPPGPRDGGRPLEAVSRDGTRIAAHRRGRGPPLLLVHGAPADHTRWATVLPLLEGAFTCYAMDRRGRGASGDGPSYALAREHEDVAALVDAAAEAHGGPVHVLGHSYGGLCALGGALLTRNLGRLALYEPCDWPPEARGYPPGFLERVDALLRAGDREGVVVAVLRDVARVPEADIQALRARPAWQARLGAAAALPRELRVDQAWTPPDLRGLRAPTLLLLGGASPAPAWEGVAMLAKALPGARVVELAGQGHVAMDTAPEAFAGAVALFLAGGSE